MGPAVPVIALAATVASAGIGAYSAIQSGEAQSAAANYQAQVAANNAKIAAYNADAATAKGNTQIQAAEEQAAQHQGMIRAVMGAGGIDINSGSSLRTQEGVAQVDQLNEATIRSNAARSAWNFRNQGADFSAQSQLDQMQASQADTAAVMGEFSSLLSGASTFSNQYNKFYPSTKSPTS